MAIQSNSKSSKGSKAAPAAKPTPTPAKASVAQMPTKVRKPYEPTQEEIQTRAFQIYVSEGCKEGNDLEYWLRAEKELRSPG